MFKNILSVFLCMIAAFTSNFDADKHEYIKQEPICYDYILHAGGITPDGKTGSNSLEALNNSYNNGYRVIEIDFCWTEDGKLACVHDWGSYYGRLFGKYSVTSEEFESARYDSYGFTSIFLEQLADWMRKHPDVIIVTDIKEKSVQGAQLISEKYPDLLDQLCFQIYHTEDYETIHELGFEKIILTVYQMTWEEKSNAKNLVEFAKNHKLVGITFPVQMLDLVPDYLEKMLLAETPLFVHTVNDVEKHKELFALGISGIYTDTGKT